MQEQLALKKLQQELENKFIKNRKELVKILPSIFDSTLNPNAHSAAVVQASRLSNLELENDGGLITFENYTMESNRIAQSVQRLLSLIKPEEAAMYLLETAKLNKILIVCKVVSEVKEMESLFPKRYYKHADVKHITDLLPKSEFEKYELVVYNNFGEDAWRIDALLQRYIDEMKLTGQPFLYFGPQLQGLEDYRDIYFSNSKFSIHSRIEEMLLYLKHVESIESQSDNA